MFKFSTLGSSSIITQFFAQIKDMVLEVLEKKAVKT